jgi:hypothetical protein
MSWILLQKTKGYSASHEIPRIIWNMKVNQYWQQPATCWYPTPDQCSTRLSLKRSVILFSHLCLGLPSGLFPSVFSTKTLYTHLLFLVGATCPSHFTILDFITKIIFGKKYRSRNFWLCCLAYFSAPSALLGPNIFLCTPFWKHPQPTFLP